MVAGSDNTRVFVSYARADIVFAEQLVIALQDRGFTAIIDLEGISAGEDWQRRLGDIILSVDVVVFVLSPDSAASETCNWEVTKAFELGKRLIPLVCRDLAGAGVPRQLRELNYIFFFPKPDVSHSGFGSGLRALEQALKVDIVWIRDQTRLGEMAERWNARGRPAALLLRGTELSAYLEWRLNKPAGLPELPAVQREFLHASEDAEKIANDLERQQIEERRRLITQNERNVRRLRRMSVVGAWFAAAFVATAIVVGWAAAKGWVEALAARSDNYAREARQLSNDFQFDKAALLSLYGKPADDRSLEGRLRWLFAGANRNAPARVQLERAYINSSLVRTLDGEARRAAFSRDGKLLATAMKDDTVAIWDVAHWRKLRVLRGAHNCEAAKMAFTPDRRRVLIACGSLDNFSVIAWQIAGGAPHVYESIGYRGDFSVDGKFVAVAVADRAVELWDAQTQRRLRVLKALLPADTAWDLRLAYDNYLRIGPDDNTIVVEPSDEKLAVFDFSGRHLWSETGHDVVFSPDGSLMAAVQQHGVDGLGGLDRSTIAVWSINPKRTVGSIAWYTLPGYLLISPDNATVLTWDMGNTIVWDLPTGKQLTWWRSPSFATSQAINKKGTIVATGYSDGISTLRDPRAPQFSDPAATFAAPNDGVRFTTFSPDESLELTLSESGTVRLWRAPHADTRRLVAGLWGAAFAKDGHDILAFTGQRAEHLDADTLQRKGADIDFGSALVRISEYLGLAVDEHPLRDRSGTTRISKETWGLLTRYVDAMRLAGTPNVSADGREIVVTSLYGSDLVDVRARTMTHLDEISSFAQFDAAGSQIVTVDQKDPTNAYTASIWSVAPLRRIRQFRIDGNSSITSIAFFDDTKLAIGFFNGETEVLDAQAPSKARILVSGEEDVTALAFSRDGTLVATGSSQGTLKIWDVATGMELVMLRDPGRNIYSIQFSPDGHKIVVASKAAVTRDDGTIFVHTLPAFLFQDVDGQVELACEKLAQAGVGTMSERDRSLYDIPKNEPDTPCRHS